MHVNVKIYIRFQILLVWTFTEYYINILGGGGERYSAPPRNNFGGAAPPPFPTPLTLYANRFESFTIVYTRNLRTIVFSAIIFEYLLLLKLKRYSLCYKSEHACVK